MTKAELRKIYLTRQRNLPPNERLERDARIAHRFFRDFDLRAVKILHCFLPIAKFGEIDTKIIIEKLRADFPQIEIVVPRVDFAKMKMDSVIYRNEAEMRRNCWEIDEPANGEKVEPQEIDVVLVPLLCCDWRGFRVGYGKGFYDRFLPSCRADCRKIGLSRFAPETLISDANEFDVKIDYCVTPNETANFKR